MKQLHLISTKAKTEVNRHFASLLTQDVIWTSYRRFFWTLRRSDERDYWSRMNYKAFNSWFPSFNQKTFLSKQKHISQNNKFIPLEKKCLTIKKITFPNRAFHLQSFNSIPHYYHIRLSKIFNPDFQHSDKESRIIFTKYGKNDGLRALHFSLIWLFNDVLCRPRFKQLVVIINETYVGREMKILHRFIIKRLNR